MIDREAVVANAKYLRNVRPIDPAEISEYVASQPHPAAVARVLRREAFDLGLVEREDGTFVPVGDDPVTRTVDRVAAVPERYESALLDLLADRFGPDWASGESGNRLRNEIRRLKADYYRNRQVEYDPVTALGYAIYHLADYYAASQYVLSALAADGLLPRKLRVLDVGAGVGGPALGLVDLLGDDALLEYHAVEPSSAADVLEALLAETGPNVHPAVHRTTAEAFDPARASAESAALDDGDDDRSASTDDTEYDLLVFANVLSELDDPVAVVDRYLDVLAPDGSLVALAPADRETAIGLRAVERSLVDPDPCVMGLDARAIARGDYEGASACASGDAPGPLRPGATVYAPTIRLWPGERPADRGWSFDVRPDLTVPESQRRLDEAGGGDGEFVNVDVQYASLLLRLDGARRIDVTPDRDRFAKMAGMDQHVTNRIDLLALKLSHDLSDGDNPLFKVGDGSEDHDHYAVLARETVLNDALRTADYGDLLSFEAVLVLWNDDEEAYNLVVDEETVVDRAPP